MVGRSGSLAFKDRRIPAREIAGKLAVSYLLEGGIRKGAGRVRIALQLIQAESEIQIWGEHYDVEEDHMLGVQDNVAEQVAGAMEPELLKTASTEAARRTSANTGAQDLVYRAVWAGKPAVFHSP